VLLPNFTTSEAVSLAESIRAEIETSKMSSKRLSITASIGVATAPCHAIEGKQLLKVADGALYAAKHDGRNLVRIAGKEPKAPTVEPESDTTNGAKHVNVVQPVNTPIAKISKDDLPSGDKGLWPPGVILLLNL